MSFTAFMVAALAAATDPHPLDDILDGLLPNTVIEGRETAPVTVEEMMAAHAVKGLSVTLIDDGKIVATRTFGVADEAGAVPVGPDTRFQAASISKPVAALAALSLVEQGALSLDGPINEHLESWQVPEHEYEADVTLRGLLAHTAGTTVSGFPGYKPGSDIPDTIGVLEGKGNTDPVIVNREPGEGFRYSGGGYTIAQLAMADVSGMDFATFMTGRILTPFGMGSSNFAPPADVADARFSRAFDGAGAMTEGGFHLYPEQAAASLWTTSEDLARFAIRLSQIHQGRGGDVVTPAMAARMMEVQDQGYALGLGVRGEGEDLRFSHGGSNEGFKAMMVAYPARGEGIVIMANSSQGIVVANAIISGVEEALDWPFKERRSLTFVPLDAASLAALAGTYQLGEDRYALAVADDILTLTNADGVSEEVIPIADGKLYLRDTGLTLDVDRDDAGAPMALEADGLRAEKVE